MTISQSQVPQSQVPQSPVSQSQVPQSPVSQSPPIGAEANDGTALVYPETDGQPMANNTVQFEWIVVLK